MVKVYGSIDVRVRERDSEISERIRARGFDVSRAVIIGYTRRTDNCFYDGAKLGKKRNAKDFPWKAVYVCPKCNRRYVMNVDDEEMRKLEKERELKLLKIREREKELYKSQRAWFD